MYFLTDVRLYCTTKSDTLVSGIITKVSQQKFWTNQKIVESPVVYSAIRFVVRLTKFSLYNGQVAVRFSRLVVSFRKRIEETFEIDTFRSDKQSKRWKGQRQGGWKVAENRTLLYNQSAGYLSVAEITKLLEGFVSGWKARMWVSDCEQLVEHEIRALVSNNVPVEVTFQCLTAGTRVQVEERTGKQISDWATKQTARVNPTVLPARDRLSIFPTSFWNSIVQTFLVELDFGFWILENWLIDQLRCYPAISDGTCDSLLEICTKFFV